ncbi:MAG: hypothetical protein KGZ79_01755 [Dethiobacter sp.]|jgi:hypothetical protein|nr:hypothetical protein [Dethiobacter sp.]
MAKKNLKPQTLLAPVPAALISCGREGKEQNIITLAGSAMGFTVKRQQ